MTARFSITVEPSRDLVRITMGGFFAAADVAAFVQERGRQMRALRCPVDAHLSLTDLRGMNIQSQDMVAQFGRVLADPASHARRIAFVVSSSLARLQLIRAKAGRPAGYFTNIAEAEAWLVSDAVAKAA